MTFNHDKYQVIIATRKGVDRAGKPLYFALLKKPKEIYISSLWSEGRGIYRGDFKGHVFRVDLSSQPENLDQLYNVLRITIGHCYRQSVILPQNQETEITK
jgi:hypothetical protein